MANVVRVRVESEWKGNSPNDRHRAFKQLFTAFKRRVDNAGIMHSYKEHQRFESNSSKRRRKKREAELRHKQEQLERRILSGERVNLPGKKKKKRKK